MSSIEEVNHLHIPIQELSDATNAFSDANLLARGGFGTVYKGVSVKHGSIAIKMLDPWQGPGKGQGDREFKTEITLLSVYKHENIVSLLGFCDEDGKKILVYKYESNGSLDKHLKRKDLTWIQRLQICLDAARGLQYLHDDVEPRIFHRDIKSSNILLDENLKAKISDFGLSRIGSVNEHSFLISNPCGTYGYIDPEYTSTGCLTQKSDVYSFGVVLFEVLCGRLACVTAYHDERQFLTNLIKIHWRRKTLNEIIYSDLKSQINSVSLVTLSSIAYQCLMSGNEHPTMKKVVEQLQKALDEQLLDGDGKRLKITLTLENENPESKTKVETSTSKKPEENSVKLPEPPKQDYIHVRARRGQATDSDSHSLAERVRREKIEERMKILQDLVPGGNKITGKALMLDEIIIYVQSLQRQVEFLSLRMARDNGPSPEWLHMQISGSFDERST